MTGPRPAMMLQRVPTHRELVAARLDFGRLSPLLRTLLTTDGTVTEALAAHFGEEVGIRVLEQGFRAYEGRANRELEVELGTRLMDRGVALFGRGSGVTLAAAFSRIVPAALPLGMQEALLAEREPLGKLMLEHRLETFKEIVDCGACAAAEAPHLGHRCATALNLAADERVVWRTYRVIHRGRPVMSITEYFPETLA
ncbi:MAG: DUF98 domain-containing protein [Nitrospirae bacterium]|nr:DUF98 domain-containing protein [Nitrospirota bacterium]